MANDFLIRPASLKDVPVILHQRRAMFFEMGKKHRVGLNDMTRAGKVYLSKNLAHGSYKGWLAVTHDGKIVAGGGVGISSWPPVPGYPHPRRATIYNVYTEPGHRRRGLARKLMLVMMEWCWKRGFATVYLHASNDGRPLYDSLGFEPTNEMRLSLKSATWKRNHLRVPGNNRGAAGPH